MANDYPPIPTHLVLGFLGAGKTTAILTLLKQKPVGETWAVLVNEFGEVGIDGALLRADGVAVKEVPGGCMCCVSGLPMQVGLNSLIRFNRPDRLFIEPTGLGHPSQIIATLTGQYYSDLLALSAAVCLVDPRRLDDPRTLENPQFQDQVAVADVLVASKADLCTPAQLAHFESWAAQWQPPKHRLFQSAGCDIDMSWLDGKFGERPARFPQSHGHNQGHTHETRSKPDLSEQPWQCYSNKGEGFYSLGWRVHPETVFDALVLHQLTHQPGFERLKGVMHTTAGWLSLNASEGTVTLLDAEPAKESRLEIIGRSLDKQALDQSLQSAISKTTL